MPATSASDATPAPAAPERLQKLLAAAGIASRREIDAWIAAGRVTVDGGVAQPGTRATASARIEIDGVPVATARPATAARVIAYHKPEGELCTRSDPAGRDTVFGRLPRLRGERWVLVGRLDFNTSGLLLATTDGDLAARLMHPSTGVEREYAVRVLGAVTAEMLDALQEGVFVDGYTGRFLRIAEAGGQGANRWYHVVIGEGRKREVRRLWDAVGARVSRLIRIRYGPVSLERSLRPGRWQELGGDALAGLYRVAGLPPPVAPARLPTRGAAPRRRMSPRPRR